MASWIIQFYDRLVINCLNFWNNNWKILFLGQRSLSIWSQPSENEERLKLKIFFLDMTLGILKKCNAISVCPRKKNKRGETEGVIKCFTSIIFSSSMIWSTAFGAFFIPSKCNSIHVNLSSMINWSQKWILSLAIITVKVLFTSYS